MDDEDTLPLLMGRMLRCPECGEWHPIESYTTLRMPALYPKLCTQVFKHGGEGGCKQLFALRHE